MKMAAATIMLEKYPLKGILMQVSLNNYSQVSLLQKFRKHLNRRNQEALLRKVRILLNQLANKKITTLFLKLIFKNHKHKDCHYRNLNNLFLIKIPNLN
jgi:hypothetical protein